MCEVVELYKRAGNVPVGVHEVIQLGAEKILPTAWFAMRVDVPNSNPSIEGCSINAEMASRFVQVTPFVHATAL